MCIVFAPVALLMPYETIEEAIEIANGTRYALGASVFGPDQDEALGVAKKLECGMVSVNDFGIFYVSHFEDFVFNSYSLTAKHEFRIDKVSEYWLLSSHTN